MNGKTSYVYDTLNRLVKVTVYNDGTAGTESVTEYRYNYNGALTHQKDANGRVTTHTVNVWDLVETTTELGLPGTEANRQFTRVYDADGRVVQRREPGLWTVTITYDEVGNVRRELGNDGSERWFTFDGDQRRQDRVLDRGADQFRLQRPQPHCRIPHRQRVGRRVHLRRRRATHAACRTFPGRGPGA